MTSSWTTYIILAAAIFSAGGVPLKEDPLVTKAKQIVAKVNSYLEDNNYSEVDLPDLGDLTSDHIKLTKVKMSNFSSMELIQGPLVVPQNESQYLIFVEIALNPFQYQFDIDMNNSQYQGQGNFRISPKVNSFIVKATVTLEDKSCSVDSANVDLYQYGDFEIDLQPDNIPNKDEVIEDILEFSSPSFLPWFVKVVETLSSVSSLKEEISNMTCQILVS